MSEHNINIGHPINGGPPVSISLQRLIESRMLLQAMSGAGKSYLLRAILEGAMPHVPAFVIDREGEFASLREQHEAVLVGRDGDVSCDVKSAALLARRLVELGVSAIIDLSDLKTHARAQFVANFLGALVNLPKKLWPSTRGKSILVAVDEAHTFCPEKQSCVATQAVIDLQSLGRKRGLAGILATQRISKLSKDAAAECSNIVVGRTSPVDQRRAADELGIPTADRHNLAQLETGVWYGIGPAFKPGLQHFRGVKAQTSHAKANAQLAPPKPSRAIQRVVPELEAIPKQAVQEAQDLAGAQAELKSLRAQLRKAQKHAPAPSQEQIDAAVAQAYKVREAEWQKQLIKANKIADAWAARVKKILKHVMDTAGVPIDGDQVDADVPTPVQPPPKAPRPSAKPARPARDTDAITPAKAAHMDATGLNPRELRVINAMRWWDTMGVPRPEKALVGIIAGYKMSGSFNAMLGSLRERGYIDYPAPGVAELTDWGFGASQAPDTPAGLGAVHDAWREKLTPPQVKALDFIIDQHPEPVAVSEIAEATGYKLSGSFNSNLAHLNKLGVIDRQAGYCSCTKLLFPDNIT